MVARRSVNLRPTRVEPDHYDVTLKFGGGLHSRASTDEIDIRECADGRNFQLDIEDREYVNRRPFTKLGTAPNASEIRGFAQLLKTDGTTSMLVQAGTAVYEWDGSSFSASKGTVSATAKLRGRLEHNWQLGTEKVLITDLNLQEDLLEWDGTTLSTSSLTGVTNFRAKYCFVSNERAFFANLNENSVALPHVIAASERSDYSTLSVSNRPSSALAIADPFQLLTPDLRAINGMVEAFGLITVSTLKGNIFKITGNSAKTDETGFDGYAIDELYPRAGASGEESVAFVGNDIYYGRQGALESLARTDKFGNVEADDLSVQIQDRIGDVERGTIVDEWTTVYNSRLDRVYFFPSGRDEVWVLQKSLLPGSVATNAIIQDQLGLSPWARWTTDNAATFQPTAVMNMLDPVSNAEYVYFGDSSGNFYQMEGTSGGDAGATDISCSRTSKVFTVPLDAQAFHVEGWIKYRKDEAATVTISLLWQGRSVHDGTTTISIPAAVGNYYNSSTDPSYYGGLFYYGSQKQKLTRKKITVPGQGNEFQVEVGFSTSTNVRINEIGLRFTAAGQ